MQSRNKFKTGSSNWIIIWGSSHELYVFNVFLTGARLNNVMPYNTMF